MTARYWIHSCLARIDAAEYGLCRRINRAASLHRREAGLRIASRSAMDSSGTR